MEIETDAPTPSIVEKEGKVGVNVQIGDTDCIVPDMAVASMTDTGIVSLLPAFEEVSISASGSLLVVADIISECNTVAVSDEGTSWAVPTDAGASDVTTAVDGAAAFVSRGGIGAVAVAGAVNGINVLKNLDLLAVAIIC